MNWARQLSVEVAPLKVPQPFYHTEHQIKEGNAKVNKYREEILKWVSDNVPNIETRDYQLEAWGKLQDRRAKGRKRALVHLATGLGKTSVAAVDVAYYLAEENPTGRVLFVSHMTDISQQAQNTFLFVNPRLKTHALQGSRHARGRMNDAQVTFTTFQTLYNKLDDIASDYFDYIIWDEAHHIEAETFSLVRKHFNPKFELGLTATPERADGRDIFNYFGHPIFAKSLAEGINDGWLSTVDYHIVFDEAIKKAMNEKFEIKSIKEIRDLFAIRTRNEVISKEVLQRREEIGLDKAKTIVFCQNIRAATEMATLLGGEVYHSNLDSEKRKNIMLRFKSGALQVICTVDMFNEGIDIPDARLIVFLRSTSSKTVFEQQLGRGLRRAPGKDQVTILDFVANIERINFVRELGRHVNSYVTSHGGGVGVGGGIVPLEGDYRMPVDTFSVNTFEFEDQVIEMLERYDELENLEHLKTEEVVAEYSKPGATVGKVAKHFHVADQTIRKHLRKGGVVFAPNYLKREEVVAKYKELGKVADVAEYFGVSWQAIKKHLSKAGVETYSHIAHSMTISPEEVAQKYHELGSINKVASHFKITTGSVRYKLKAINVEITTTNLKNYASPELIEAYQRLGSVRGAAKEVGLSKHQAMKRFRNSGINTSKFYVKEDA